MMHGRGWEFVGHGWEGPQAHAHEADRALRDIERQFFDYVFYGKTNTVPWYRA